MFPCTFDKLGYRVTRKQVYHWFNIMWKILGQFVCGKTLPVAVLETESGQLEAAFETAFPQNNFVSRSNTCRRVPMIVIKPWITTHCTMSTISGVNYYTLPLPSFCVMLDQISLLRELTSLFKKKKPGILLQSHIIGTYVSPCTVGKPVWHIRLAVGHKVPTRMKLLEVRFVDVTRIEQMMLGSVYTVKCNF